MISIAKDRILENLMRHFIFYISICLLGFSLSTFAFQAIAAECVNWPEVMLTQKMHRLPKGKHFILVHSFVDKTKVTGDQWLEKGIARLVEQYLDTAAAIKAIPTEWTPYLSKRQKVRYNLEGFFQHTSGQLRIFIQLKNRTNKLITQKSLTVPYPHNKQFFVAIREAIESILKNLPEVKDINFDQLNQIQNATGSIQAYSNWVRGQNLLEKYKPQEMEATIVWFEQARSLDHRYLAAYIGLANTYAFLALNAKQQRESFRTFLQKTEKTLQQMENIAVKKKKKQKPFLEQPWLSARILKAHSFFITALHAMAQQKWRAAIQAFEEVNKITPEDSMAYFHLAKIYDKLGRKVRYRAKMQTAREMNRCL